jgi:hypothetical protein
LQRDSAVGRRAHHLNVGIGAKCLRDHPADHHSIIDDKDSDTRHGSGDWSFLTSDSGEGARAAKACTPRGFRRERFASGGASCAKDWGSEVEIETHGAMPQTRTTAARVADFIND